MHEPKLLTQGNHITIDESSVTGETDLIVKCDYVKLGNDFTTEKAKKETPFLSSGAKVMEGTGSFLVQAIVAGFLGIVFFFKSVKDYILGIFGYKSKDQNIDDI